MAIEIKAIPTLTGDEAERFVAAADAAEKEVRERGPIDMSKQFEEMRAILKKAEML